MKYLFLSLATVFSAEFGLYAQTSETTEADDFLIEIEQREGKIMLQCQSGCAWKELSFNVRDKQAINALGMTEPEENDAQHDPELADFLISISPSGNSIELQGIKGTNWKTLSYSGHPATRYKIDRSGMIRIN